MLSSAERISARVCHPVHSLLSSLFTRGNSIYEIRCERNHTKGVDRMHAQKSVMRWNGKAVRTAFRTAAKSMISCAMAPPMGGR